MIGRYTNLGKYRELLQMKEFYLVLTGSLLILSSYGLGKNEYPVPADISALLALVVLGGPIILGAGKGLLNRELNVDELVSLAMVASVLIGEYLPAAVVALIMVLGSLLEQYTAQKARSAIDALIRLSPGEAAVLRDGVEISVPVREIRLGDQAVIRPGEKVPVDGEVVRGSASLNQSSLTGESLPVDKTVGDTVYAGSVSYSGMIVVEARKVGEDTTLGKLIQLVRDAESQKAPILRVTDRYAGYFTPFIIAIGIGVYLMTGDLHRAITVLIVGCPCAFIISAPTAIVAALGNASKNGILIKGGALLEEVARIDTIVFDKTGTLTTGNPVVAGITPLNGVPEEHVLALAAAAEKYSEHPLARAVLKAAEQRELVIAEPAAFKNIPGLGVEAAVEGKNIFVGAEASGHGTMGGAQSEPGVKTLLVKENDIIIGAIYIKDNIRAGAEGLVKSLPGAGLKRIQMLTGDEYGVAAHVAGASGIREFWAGFLPGQKLNHIQELQRSGHKVAMVGDGINDAPALAAADIGIAMGAMGTDVAMEAADIALLEDNLAKLPYLMQLGRTTLKTINFNIGFAVVFNLLALAASGAGLLNPVTGAFAHNVGSVLVVLNSARLRGFAGGTEPVKSPGPAGRIIKLLTYRVGGYTINSRR
ncbi:hypothetical ptotein [Desulfocucumis palustris]|uniref:Cd(2+)-exporting ATPase n=1 Tax=Desulfocucumis palustris TaxID=1898651 RepID=A0A2L2XAK9_9FIRM|nr:cation-translocating P-type ATPase [Desulfocucumis palustris]GBF33102.1 hypothetical ptotein [Desulfocucumis palustris]